MKPNLPTVRHQRRRLGIALALCVAVLTGCHWDMWDDARLKPLEPEPFFANAASSRTLIPESVPYKQANLDSAYFEGKNTDGTFVTHLPAQIELTRELLNRGRERYAVYCTPCHGFTGDGDGMIVRRGFPLPPSYNIDRLRTAELGYFYDVITNGFGRMYSYASRISVDDRWAIAAYVRALQLSQAATPETLSSEDFEAIKQLALNPPAPPAADDGHGGGHGADAAHGDESHGDDATHESAGDHGQENQPAGDHGQADEHGTDHGSEH